tara:strand:- start:8759 stop:8986 length:228 start_codon:yes stop_codon:yes gene_type:complete
MTSSRPNTKEEAYATLHLEDVLAAVHWIKTGMVTGMSKRPAIEYVKHWKDWSKLNDIESYNKITEAEQISEATPE